MRTIKFRAWDTLKKEMQNHVPVLLLDEDMAWPHRSDFLHNTQQWTSDDGLMVNPVLMQFVGLLDKNGREIYEEDIVRYEINGSVSRVCWEQDICTYCFNDGLNRINVLDSRFIEVVGNSYENPELLKKKAADEPLLSKEFLLKLEKEISDNIGPTMGPGAAF